MKTQKGITLIALIITIVVLLILAVVAISSINDTDLLSRANNAATKWNEGVRNEEKGLNYLAHQFDKYTCDHDYVRRLDGPADDDEHAYEIIVACTKCAYKGRARR